LKGREQGEERGGGFEGTKWMRDGIARGKMEYVISSDEQRRTNRVSVRTKDLTDSGLVPKLEFPIRAHP
jgi:hypothetical protein